MGTSRCGRGTGSGCGGGDGGGGMDEKHWRDGAQAQEWRRWKGIDCIDGMIWRMTIRGVSE